MALLELKCFSCGEKLEFSDAVSRRSECGRCKADVRCCRNCRFYDPKVYNECRETSAEVVREKERSNMCDFFSPGSATAEVDSRASLLAAAEALFKKN